MSAPTEQEVRREGKRILRKLLGGAELRRRKTGDYAVIRPRGDPETARGRVSPALIAALQGRGLLDAGPEGLTVSEAGRAWYVREMSGQGAAGAFAAQHRQPAQETVRDAQGMPMSVTVNQLESPLRSLFGRHLLDRTQFEAGERLRRDYTLGHLSPRLGMNWDAPCRREKRAQPGTVSETALAAKQRFRAAMKAAGPDFADLLFDVCCDLCGMETLEKRHGWPRASGKVVLRLGLNRLARHYGMARPVRHARLRVWAEKETGGEDEMVGGEGFEPPTPSV